MITITTANRSCCRLERRAGGLRSGRNGSCCRGVLEGIALLLLTIEQWAKSTRDVSRLRGNVPDHVCNLLLVCLDVANLATIGTLSRCCAAFARTTISC